MKFSFLTTTKRLFFVLPCKLRCEISISECHRRRQQHQSKRIRGKTPLILREDFFRESDVCVKIALITKKILQRIFLATFLRARKRGREGKKLLQWMPQRPEERERERERVRERERKKERRHSLSQKREKGGLLEHPAPTCHLGLTDVFLATGKKGVVCMWEK